MASTERWCRVPGCRRKEPLPKGQRGLQCSTCLVAKRERRPLLYRGACVCGCGAPNAGGRSGLARLCYLRALRRRKSFKRVMKEITGIPLPADHLALALRSILPPVASVEVRRATHALLGLLNALHTGRVMVNRYTTAHSRWTGAGDPRRGPNAPPPITTTDAAATAGGGLT